MDAYLSLSLVIGTILTLIFMEFFGVSPGGLIVPGYLAVYCTNPREILIVVVLSLLTYLIVVKGLSRVMILYGKRKFAAMLGTAILIKLGIDFSLPLMGVSSVASGFGTIQGVGFIVPGLIANTMQKQGWAYTYGSTALMTGITFGALLLALQF